VGEVAQPAPTRPRFCYTIGVAFGHRGVVRALLVAAAAAILLVAWTSRSSGARLHAAQAASASATAFRVRDSAGTHGLVSVSGIAGRTVRGVGASTSTSGGHGTASSYVQLKHVSVYNGLIRASSVKVDASANGYGGGAGGKISNLVVAGESKGSPTKRHTYDLGGFGHMVVLDRNRNGIAGIRATLTRDYEGIPAGASVTVAYASAVARNAVASAPSTASAPASQPRASAPQGGPQSQNTGGGGSGGAANSGPAPLPRRTPPAVRLLNTTRGFTFPVYGPHNYTDTFGAFRADTGFHEGNDIFAAAGTPVVAVTAGRLNRVGTLRISGNRLWVKSFNGDCFFYAHLSAFATDARNGLRVKAGQVVGFVGSTGDAEKTPPHLHFEVHPGCGAAVDPYPFLRAWEGRRDVPAAAWLVRYGRDYGVRPGQLVELRDFLSGS
jgi:murein DD-endopeptidase MepM/ murein hydrolase activator NlpD